MNRRELLEAFGIAGAASVLWACGGSQKATAVQADAEVGRDDVRTWLRDAVSKLAAVYPVATALAVERRRSLAASDQLGAGIARARRDGVVLTVRDRDGWHEQVTSDLTRGGVAAAVRALVPAGTKPLSVAFGPEPPAAPVPKPYGEQELRNRVEAITRKRLDSRVVYGLSLFDVEDTSVWFVAPGHDREQRSLRVRQRVTRAAWNGARPAVGEVERGWIGEIVDRDRQLGEADAERATASALELMTPEAFPDGTYPVLLDPSVVASLLEAGTRALLTTTAARRPEVRKGIVPGAMVASPAITLIDDPTTRGAYGGFQFDDEGEPAAAITLIDRGKLTGTLADRQGRTELGDRTRLLVSAARARRAGHVGLVEPLPSHLRLVAGTMPHDKLAHDGFWIEGSQGVLVDPGTTRIVIAAARAREIRAGQRTGRVYADIELVGDLGRLFATAIAASSNTSSFVYRDERDGEPRWRSVETPWVQHGADAGITIRARRRSG